MSNNIRRVGRNLYAVGKAILASGLAGGERMTRAKRLHDASTDKAVRDEAWAVWQEVNCGQIPPEEADRRLDALEPDIKFMVETWMMNGWYDAEWTEDDEPLRFATRAEAQQAIDDLVRDTQAAVKRGDMLSAEEPWNFRIVPDYGAA